jgi:PPOX class probable FMN-dependent enzyme
VGEGGTDCSPKGDAAGFIQVLDERTLALPDRPGNNRIDSLRNIVLDPRVSLLFLVPGVGESLRVNGRAQISIDPDLLKRFEVRGKLPRTVIIVHVEAAYFHCSKALVRSSLWDPAKHVDRASLPSAGDMHRRLSGGTFDGSQYDKEMPERTAAGLY